MWFQKAKAWFDKAISGWFHIKYRKWWFKESLEKPTVSELNKKNKSWSQKQIMWFPSLGLHIYVSALDSELFELELVASTSELLSATSYP
jgi:hypothetical protein